MADSVFVDANGWIALLNSADTLHQRAVGVWHDLVTRGSRFVLTDWIVAETGNGLARARPKPRLNEALDLLTGSSRCELVVVDGDLLNRSLEFYSRHADKLWGLTDCASFVVMQDRSIREAFTSDHHFEQAGFACLLKP